MSPLYAHTPGPHGRWHLLDEHIRAVAQEAQGFAAAFGADEVAYWLGLWHDIGKCNPAFQDYLAACVAHPKQRVRGPDHKAAGTHVALPHIGALALLVQGHHGGLKEAANLRAWLNDKMNPAMLNAIEQAKDLLGSIEPPSKIALPQRIMKLPHDAEFFMRMLFSALVDADFLDTEAHFEPDRAELRGNPHRIADLWERFEVDQRSVSGQRTDLLSEARHTMYEACLRAAALPPGLFRLAIPTGGGKTRSAMAFALRHALCHGHRRVIVAVPFITITEQTADTYRSIFEPDAADVTHPVVLEHHSGTSQREQDDEFDPAATRMRLAAENWDAPIVVTTTVQLFESLFANTPMRCRKLHRLARSVIVLDEAQALPVSLLEPILDGLRILCAQYGVTVVLSTATQPAFDTVKELRDLPAVDIVPDAARWYAALKRVEYEWRVGQPATWPEIADLMHAEPQVLAVVNTKKDALALIDALDDPQVLHLSTLLCGAHRRAVIREVKRRLANDEPCRLVSTQLIEAGVDLDFPLVLRANAPLDSIIQAAGRCNREGRLARGRVIVFEPAEGNLPRGIYTIATSITRTFIDDTFEPDDPDAVRRYFERLLGTISDRDAPQVQSARKVLDFPETAKRFRMITEDTEDVVVTYGSADEQRMVRAALDRLEHGWGSTRLLLRQIQPYIVSIPACLAERYRRLHLIQPLIPGLGIWLGAYDAVRGITGEDIDRESLVV